MSFISRLFGRKDEVHVHVHGPINVNVTSDNKTLFGGGMASQSDSQSILNLESPELEPDLDNIDSIDNFGEEVDG